MTGMVRRWRPWRTAALGTVLVLATAAVDGTLLAQQAASLAPASRAPPVTLAAVPLTGTTVQAQSSATTTGLLPLVGVTSTLTMARTDGRAWDVRVAVTSSQGVAGSETLVVALAGGAVTQAVTVGAATPLPLASGPVVLDDGPVTVGIATANALAGCHSCTVQVELRLAPVGSPHAAAAYRYSVATAP